MPSSLDQPLWITKSPEEFERLKTKALRDFWTFLDVIHYRGGTQEFGDIHKDLSDFLQGRGDFKGFAGTNEPMRKLILMPRGHLKSTLCSVAYVLWRIYKDPNIRILVGTAVKELATDFVRTVKQYLEDEELGKRVWNARPHIEGNLIPELDAAGKYRKARTRNKRNEYDQNYEEGYTEAADKKVMWAASQLQVVRPMILAEPTLRAASVGTSITGQHYDLIIMDDLVTFENSDTPAKASRVTSWAMDIESVVNPFDPSAFRGEQFIILGTRYYKWDYYGHLVGEDIEKDEDLREFLAEATDDPLEIFHRDIYRNGNHYTGTVSLDYLSLKHNKRVDHDEYLWPEGFNELVHKRVMRRLSARRYASQYLNQIIEETETVLQVDLIHQLSPKFIEIKPNLVELTLGSNDAPKLLLRPFLVVDPAAGLSDKSDYSVVMVGSVDSNNRAFIFDLKFGRWTPAILHNTIIQMVKKYGLRAISVEAVGYQLSLVLILKQQLKAEGLNVFINEFKPRGDKKSRIESLLEPLIRDQRLYVAHYIMGTKEFREQMEFFPAKGVHDDIPDALAMLLEVAKPVDKALERQRERMMNKYRERMKVNRKWGGLR